MTEIKSISPHSLVMTPNQCEYCNTTEDISETIIEYLFGINHCKKHSTNADQDCQIFMKKYGIIQFNRIKENTKLKKFIDHIINKSFAVLRSSGKLEFDWHISKIDELQNFTQMIKYLPNKNSVYPWFVNVSNGKYNKWVCIYSIVEYLHNNGDNKIINYYNDSLLELKSMVELNE